MESTYSPLQHLSMTADHTMAGLSLCGPAPGTLRRSGPPSRPRTSRDNGSGFVGFSPYADFIEKNHIPRARPRLNWLD